MASNNPHPPGTLNAIVWTVNAQARKDRGSRKAKTKGAFGGKKK
jgi:hypothetical protein